MYGIGLVLESDLFDYEKSISLSNILRRCEV